MESRISKIRKLLSVHLEISLKQQNTEAQKK